MVALVGLEQRGIKWCFQIGRCYWQFRSISYTLYNARCI